MGNKIKVYDTPVKDPSRPQSRWPFTHNPKSWFVIERSSELAKGEVKPLEYFGKQLVLFRDEDGEAQLLDAYCPHMGAHLGYGGVVDGKNIRCPFHAWEFDGTGTCQKVPYAEKIPNRAVITPWHLVEKNGLILAWNNEDGGDPEFEVPDFDEYASDEWSDYEYHEWFVRSNNLELGENSVDTAHFKYLHGVPDMPENIFTEDGPFLGSRSETDMETPMGNMQSAIDTMSYGLGFARVLFTGITDVFLVVSQTPMDGERMHIRFNFMLKKDSGADPNHGVGRAFIDEICRQLEQDIPIWENKVYIKPPNLVDTDGPVPGYRRWASQFYPEGSF